MIIEGIKLVSRASLKIEFDDGRYVIILGEMMSTPKFEANISSIKKWKYVNSDLEDDISSHEKELIIEKVITFSESKGNASIYFI